MDIKEELQAEVNPGVIEKFFEQLPEKVFHLGLRVLLAALALLIGIQLIRLIRHVLKKALKKSRVEDSALHFIDSFIKFGLYFILILLIAAGMGVDATSILALLGSAGVAIGLAVQGSLGNLVGGILILILKPFGVDDYIKDNQGNEGVVDNIDVFFTQLRTLDNKVIFLPNGNLANGSITNYTKCTERRIDIPVGIAYKEDIRMAREVLEAVLTQEDMVLKSRERVIFVDSLGESSVNLNVRCWVRKENYWEAKWKLTEKVKYALDEAEIRIPFPQLDIHMEKNSK